MKKINKAIRYCFVLFILFLIFNPYTVLAQKKVNVDLEDANVIDALKLLSSISGLNIVADDSVKGKKITISLKNIPAMDALDLIVSATGVDYQIIDDKTILVATMERLRQSVKGRQTEKIQLSYIDVSEAKGILDSYVTNPADLQVNVTTNEIIITEVTSRIKKIKEVVAEIDAPPAQILLEARVIEVSSTNLKQIGFDWDTAITQSIFESGAGEIVPLSEPLRFARTKTLRASAIISFLESEGKGKILASPRVTTLNKREATLDITEKIPYPVRTFDASGKETVTMATVDVGVSLKITPQVNVGGYITVQIKPKVSSIIEFAGPRSEFPRVVVREAQTIVRVKDGETIILGGLNKNEDLESIRKIPLLGDIPFIGLLFKSRRIEKVNTEIVIFVTPHLLKEPVLTK